jgi:hypothetical protein
MSINYLFFILNIKRIELSVVRNSIMFTDGNKLESNQQKFAVLCFNPFFPQVYCSYAYALEQLKLHTLSNRRYNHDTFFLIQVYLGSKFYPSLSETSSLRVPARYVRELYAFNTCSSSKNCHSAICALTDVF